MSSLHYKFAQDESWCAESGSYQSELHGKMILCLIDRKLSARLATVLDEVAFLQSLLASAQGFRRSSIRTDKQISPPCFIS